MTEETKTPYDQTTLTKETTDTPSWWHKPEQVHQWSEATEQTRQHQNESYSHVSQPTRGPTRFHRRGRGGRFHNHQSPYRQSNKGVSTSNSSFNDRFDKPPPESDALPKVDFRKSFIEDPWAKFNIGPEKEEDII